jgi:hypothetical protein
MFSFYFVLCFRLRDVKIFKKNEKPFQFIMKIAFLRYSIAVYFRNLFVMIITMLELQQLKEMCNS